MELGSSVAKENIIIGPIYDEEDGYKKYRKCG